MQAPATRLQGLWLLLQVVAAFGLCIGLCGGTALCLSFFAFGKPSFMGPALEVGIPLGVALGGLAGIFYVPLFAGRKLPLWLRLLEVLRYEVAALACLLGPLAFGFTPSFTHLLHALFTPEALSAIKAFNMQASPPGLLILWTATVIKWVWEHRLKLRVKLSGLQGRIRQMLPIRPRNV